jgi:xanthine/uracil permease
LQEKTAALLFLWQLQVTILKNAFKRMAAKAAEQSLSKKAAIIALRNLARQLGVNRATHKMLQAVPVVGAAVGATANATFIGDVAWAARRSYQERWFADRDEPLS